MTVVADPPPPRPVLGWCWRLAGSVFFRATPHNFNPVRRGVLRLFGTTVGRGAKVRRSVRIDRPWNLRLGDLAAVGDRAVIRARWPVTIGDRSVVSQLAIVTTEERHPSAAGHPRQGGPIVIEDDCWIAADALVLPGTTVRRGTVAGARSTVEGELPPWTVATGAPARPRRPRTLA